MTNMKNRDYRKKQGIREKDKCYLCNNKAQMKCSRCKGKICNDCRSMNDNHKCYKCDVLEVEKL